MKSILISLFPAALAEDAGAIYSRASSAANELSPVAALLSMILPGLIFCVVFGIVSHLIAKKKGYSGYFWTGFFLWVIGVVYVAALPIASQLSAPAPLSDKDRHLLSSFHALPEEEQKNVLSMIRSSSSIR